MSSDIQQRWFRGYEPASPVHRSIQLGRCGIFLLAVSGGDEHYSHVVGLNLHSGCFRVSSPIALISAEATFVVTCSGRVYDLVGQRGPGDECRAVIERLAAP